VTRIDTPRLVGMEITLYRIESGCPRLAQFFNRSPTLRVLDEAHVQFDNITASSLRLRSRTSMSGLDNLLINIICTLNLRFSSVARLCNSSLPPFSTVEDLYIGRKHSELVFQNIPWIQLLLPFTAVKNLYLSEEFALGVAAALQELVEGRISEALPSLQSIFVEGFNLSVSFRENIGQFVSTRKLFNHPITISVWTLDKDSDRGSL